VRGPGTGGEAERAWRVTGLRCDDTEATDRLAALERSEVSKRRRSLSRLEDAPTHRWEAEPPGKYGLAGDPSGKT
jgi:hypothetical protein